MEDAPFPDHPLTVKSFSLTYGSMKAQLLLGSLPRSQLLTTTEMSD